VARFEDREETFRFFSDGGAPRGLELREIVGVVLELFLDERQILAALEYEHHLLHEAREAECVERDPSWPGALHP